MGAGFIPGFSLVGGVQGIQSTCQPQAQPAAQMGRCLESREWKRVGGGGGWWLPAEMGRGCAWEPSEAWHGVRGGPQRHVCPQDCFRQP